jgi:ketosteroid isomerase-like protein
MKRTIYFSLFVMVMLFLTSSTIQMDEELKQIKNTIELLNEKYCNAWINEDLATYLSLYTDDAVVMPPYSPAIKGKSALTVSWNNQFNSGLRYLSAKTTTLDIWFSDDMVYERGSYLITMNVKENKRPVSVSGSYFSVWQKQEDGSYKMKYDISNLDHGI